MLKKIPAWDVKSIILSAKSTAERPKQRTCVFCNQAKGSDVGSIALETGLFVRFFNPRVDGWSEHFRLNGYRIEPVTDVGAVTVRILQFNSIERLLERQALALADRYPSGPASKHIASDR